MPEFDSTVEYRDVPGYRGYRAGSDGSLWSCRTHLGRWGDDGRLGATFHRVKGNLTKHGYRMACVRRDDGHKGQASIHRLVLLAFVGPCPEGMQCLHEDDDKDNNTLANLSWGTPAKNGQDRAKRGRQPRGEAHAQARLKEEDVRTIRALFDGRPTVRDVAKQYGVAEDTVYKILSRKLWKHVVPSPS